MYLVLWLCTHTGSEVQEVQKGGYCVSYISGFMMGATLGKAIHRTIFGGKSKAPQKSHTPRRGVASWEVKSILQGRRRYYAASLVGNAALANHIVSMLESLPYIQKVEIHTTTGSLLILHTGREEEIDRIVAKVRELLVSLHAHGGAVEREEGVAMHPLAKMGASISRTMHAANGVLRRATAGWLDFRSLFSFVFIVRGIRKVIALGQRPSGPQMLWWAMSLLRGWRMP